MKKLFFRLLAVVSSALFAWAIYLVVTGPAVPLTPVEAHDAAVARLNHLYTVAAYAITWAIQIGYVAWLGLKWPPARVSM